MPNNNTKPDWSKAPKWANWFAVDYGGFGFFYRNKPTFHKDVGFWIADFPCNYEKSPGRFFKDAWEPEFSLIERPSNSLKSK